MLTYADMLLGLRRAISLNMYDAATFEKDEYFYYDGRYLYIKMCADVC
jgi:hypothetical protein